MTRLDQGQLWFSAGRRRSPWRHEVHVGPAIVSTPRGRFQATAEPDGGATIACLAGRTRVVAGLREPVLLGPDQSAAVSSDGRTLVVMDRTSGAAVDDADLIDLTDGAELPPEADLEALEVPELAAVGAAEAVGGHGARSGPRYPDLPGDEPSIERDPVPLPYADDHQDRPARLGWIPELVAVAAIVALVVAAMWVFTRSDAGGASDTAQGPAPTVPITSAPTTAAPTTAVPTTAAPATTAVATTVPATTTPSRPTASSASASGQLSSCRRAPGGVLATVAVTHRSGPAARFTVSAALVDAAGTQFATGSADTELVQPNATATAQVLISVSGRASGSCELVGVAAR